LSKLGIPVYRGTITGEKIEVDTLLWIPSKRASPLIQKLVENLGLELDDQGNVKTDEMRQTNVRGLYAAGDVHGSMGALAAAYDGRNPCQIRYAKPEHHS
jgi:pyruvate/2-oxoglutarate dehydrogenase complex dihydrolipoamide dehydrogenase (E3) component